MVEVCEASGVNFALLCSENVNIAMKKLHADRRISKGGTFQDGTYFELLTSEKNLVNKMAEEVCLSTRFISLTCNEIHSWSKQELLNDMVKGDNKYPQTMAASLHFLQYHTLRNNGFNRHTKSQDQGHTLAQDDDSKKVVGGGKPSMASKPCGKHKDGTCPYKVPHILKESPTNKWGINKDKTVIDDGATLL